MRVESNETELVLAPSIRRIAIVATLGIAAIWLAAFSDLSRKTETLIFLAPY